MPSLRRLGFVLPASTRRTPTLRSSGAKLSSSVATLGQSRACAMRATRSATRTKHGCASLSGIQGDADIATETLYNSCLRAFRIVLPAYWVLLALATHWPTVAIPGPFEWRDKVVHLVCFGILAFLFIRFATPRLGIALAVLVPYAALDEYTQQFVGRYTELADWFANVAGIVLVVVGFALVRRARARSTR